MPNATPDTGSPSRGPGRPPAEAAADVKTALLRAAARLFAERGYAGTSLREIAEAASVTPAMVRYYFGDKEGLLLAVFDSVVGRLLERVRRLAEHPQGDEPLAARFIHAYLDVIGPEPWIPQLLVREVLSANPEIRDRIRERFARPIASLVPPLIAAEIEAGRLHRGLDPRLAVLSLIGMCVFPYVAHPLIGSLLGYELTPEFARELADHTADVFVRGTMPVSEGGS